MPWDLFIFVQWSSDCVNCKKWCSFGSFDVIAIWEVQAKIDEVVFIDIMNSAGVYFNVDNGFVSFAKKYAIIHKLWGGGGDSA